MKKILMGVIGLGSVYEFQKQALQTMEEIDVIALCDTNKEKAYEEASRLDATHYLDYRQLLDNKDIEAVLVSTPVATHYEIGMAVLSSRKHLLIEKPATLSIQELEDLQITAANNGVKLIVAFHAAYAKDLLWFNEKYKKELYDILGPVTKIECQFFDPYIIDGKLDNKAISLGGSWVDSGINALSVIAQLVEPGSIKFKEKLMVEKSSYSTPNISAVVTYESISDYNQNCIITINTDWTLNKNLKKSTLYFGQSQNKIILHHSNQQALMINHLNETTTLADFSQQDIRLVAHYKGVFKDFYERISINEDNFDFTAITHKLLLEPMK